MSITLYTWNTLVRKKINLRDNLSSASSFQEVGPIIEESGQILEKLKVEMITGMVAKAQVKDKRQFIRVHQSMLIRLLNVIEKYKKDEEISEPLYYLYCVIGRQLESALEFIEEMFSNYFDRSEKVPSSYLIVAKRELEKDLNTLKYTFSNNSEVNSELAALLFQSYNDFISKPDGLVSFNDLLYQKEVMNELIYGKAALTDDSINEILYYFNFNDESYTRFLIQGLEQISKSELPVREKIDKLLHEQKVNNQMLVRYQYSLLAAHASIKSQINNWIEEEVKFLEKGVKAGDENVPKALDAENKISTSLSVSRLALLIRLMVMDNVINNRSVAPVLRTVVKVFSTLQKQNISFGSLEAKFHNPDKGTIDAVKEMIFRWVTILNKL